VPVPLLAPQRRELHGDGAGAVAVAVAFAREVQQRLRGQRCHRLSLSFSRVVPRRCNVLPLRVARPAPHRRRRRAREQGDHSSPGQRGARGAVVRRVPEGEDLEGAFSSVGARVGGRGDKGGGGVKTSSYSETLSSSAPPAGRPPRAPSASPSAAASSAQRPGERSRAGAAAEVGCSRGARVSAASSAWPRSPGAAAVSGAQGRAGNGSSGCTSGSSAATTPASSSACCTRGAVEALREGRGVSD